MLVAALALAAVLAQRSHSFEIVLDATVAEAAPLFGPVREAEWAPGWAPHFVHPADGGQQEGAVFTTTTPKGYERLWTLTAYDVAAGRVSYVVVTPGFSVEEITIRIAPDGARRCRAIVTYRRSALVPSANADADALDAHWAAAQAPHWQQAINAALRRSAR